MPATTMDIKSMTPDEIQAARRRLARCADVPSNALLAVSEILEGLKIRSCDGYDVTAKTLMCSRKSFFGGSVSTRADSVAPSYKLRQVDTQAVQSKSGARATPTAQQPRKPAAKRPRATTDDFGSLEDDDVDDIKPAPAVKVRAQQEDAMEPHEPRTGRDASIADALVHVNTAY